MTMTSERRDFRALPIQLAAHIESASTFSARLRVRDNGVGISEEDRQRIFDPFLHPKPVKHHTSAGPDSAGLGLYIARGLIELHGGLITVDSEPEVFTEFTVLLPFKQRRERPGSSDPPTSGSTSGSPSPAPASG